MNKCYRKKKRSDTPFPLETKLAIILNTVFVTFTYGFPMPLLYLCCVFPLLVLSVCDKLLVTYWCKLAPKHSDRQMRVFTNILKYAPFFCLLQCGWTVFHLGAMYSPQPIDTFKHAIGEPFQMNIKSPIIYTLGTLQLILFFTLIVFDMSAGLYAYFTRTKDHYNSPEGEDLMRYSYLLSDVQRKQLLC